MCLCVFFPCLSTKLFRNEQYFLNNTTKMLFACVYINLTSANMEANINNHVWMEQNYNSNNVIVFLNSFLS